MEKWGAPQLRGAPHVYDVRLVVLLELNLWSLANRLAGNLKAFARAELRAGNYVARERGNGIVVLKDAVVVAHACVADLVLGVGEVGLELLEVGVGLKLRIRLNRDEQTAQGVGQVS